MCTFLAVFLVCFTVLLCYSFPTSQQKTAEQIEAEQYFTRFGNFGEPYDPEKTD